MNAGPSGTKSREREPNTLERFCSLDSVSYTHLDVYKRQRISQVVGLEYDPTNYLLMHAMGPNVAGVIGSAVAAGILLGFLM